MNTIANTNAAAINSGTPLLSVDGNQGGDAIGQLNELMVQLGQLFGKLRDLLRQYNQIQQNNAFQMQKTSFDTRMQAIETEFDAKNKQAWAQIGTGIAQGLAGAASAFGAAQGSWLAHSGDIGKGIGSIVDGSIGVAVNPELREAQEKQAEADYQHGLAEQQLKRADETLEKALKVSSDLREILSTLTQAHERLSSSVRMS
ncbi:type III secretion protein [Chromobacterium amazonense]|uniref:Type III secretion protein n=1 Tax=Chromobacterium amazonense TaxID=1382803 RepID=A0ABU8V0B2_9NEIS|nr:type III secretion protein [Chromobacterium amazonense]KIA79289.1 type III secretion protein [Chromobacterium piscinae]MBM2883554.1 hypothetical protein [Chromobacterium amazonense]MDE1712313.1 hypothetical protein [Chromobacterium amazonense]MDQ4541733.1 hypothetical protein [Chromobacterium amazonense]